MCPASIRMFFRFLRCDFQTSPAETGVFGLQTYPMRSERLLGTLSSEKSGTRAVRRVFEGAARHLADRRMRPDAKPGSEVSDEEGGSPVMEKKSLGNDIQKSVPATPVALSRVGVTGLRRVLRLTNESGGRPLFFAEMDLFAHLGASRSGVHMSRFIENMEEIASEIASEASPDCETLAERMALSIARTQDTSRSEVRIRVQYPRTKRAPVSGRQVEDLYTFLGVAISDGASTRRAVGVEVNGLTVCPCAREMVSERSRELLLQAGYSSAQADGIVAILPLASHNQRGRGTLLLGTEMPVRAEELVDIVESSMSSEIYELLKRPDELHVVERAHHKPRFVEDVVREMIRGVAERLTHLPDETFVLASQENMESIHMHNAFAERCALLGDIRRELSDPQNASLRCRVLSLEAWLANLL